MVKSCCCYFSIRTGALILGWNAIILNAIELVEFVEIRAYTNLILSPFFFLVVCCDSKVSRQVWFAAFLLYLSFNVIYDWIVFSEKTLISVQTNCDEMKADGHSFKEMGFTTAEDCIMHNEPYALGLFTLFFAAYIALNLHYVAVNYQFTKDADKPRSEGGCEEEDIKIRPSRFDNEE